MEDTAAVSIRTIDPVLDMPKSIANSLARHRIAEIVFSDNFEMDSPVRLPSKEFYDDQVNILRHLITPAIAEVGPSKVQQLLL